MDIGLHIAKFKPLEVFAERIIPAAANRTGAVVRRGEQTRMAGPPVR